MILTMSLSLVDCNIVALPQTKDATTGNATKPKKSTPVPLTENGPKTPCIYPATTAKRNGSQSGDAIFNKPAMLLFIREVWLMVCLTAIRKKKRSENYQQYG